MEVLHPAKMMNLYMILCKSKHYLITHVNKIRNQNDACVKEGKLSRRTLVLHLLLTSIQASMYKTVSKEHQLTTAYSCPSKVHQGNFPLTHRSVQDEPMPIVKADH